MRRNLDLSRVPSKEILIRYGAPGLEAARLRAGLTVEALAERARAQFFANKPRQQIGRRVS